MPAKMRKGKEVLFSAFALGFFFLCTVINMPAQRISPGPGSLCKMIPPSAAATTRTGRYWTGALVNDLSVRGRVVARAGSKVRGRVADAESSGRLSKPGILALNLRRSMDSRPDGHVCSRWCGPRQEQCHQDRRCSGGWRSLGGIFGGGKGAAIGAGAGAAGNSRRCGHRQEGSDDPCRIDSYLSGNKTTG